VIGVIGGTGFLGTPVAHALATRGERVRVLARNAVKTRTRSGTCVDATANIEVVGGDVHDAEALDRLLTGARAAYVLVQTVTGRQAAGTGDFVQPVSAEQRTGRHDPAGRPDRRDRQRRLRRRAGSRRQGRRRDPWHRASALVLHRPEGPRRISGCRAGRATCLRAALRRRQHRDADLPPAIARTSAALSRPAPLIIPVPLALLKPFALGIERQRHLPRGGVRAAVDHLADDSLPVRSVLRGPCAVGRTSCTSSARRPGGLTSHASPPRTWPPPAVPGNGNGSREPTGRPGSLPRGGRHEGTAPPRTHRGQPRLSRLFHCAVGNQSARCRLFAPLKSSKRRPK
jgi:hypothetical protein